MAGRNPSWSGTYNPDFEPRRRRFGTTPVELLHITAAMGVLTAVLFIVFEGNAGFAQIHKLPVGVRLLAAFLISFLGFVLHELGHKFTAQHFGHWSEFRAYWFMLGVALLVAYYLHIPIAAPGATWHNAYSKADQGKISAMGPLVNYAVAVCAWPFTIGRHALTSVGGQLAAIILAFSTILALFNLVPLGPLDGRKVIAWNPLVWVVMVLLGVGLLWSARQSFVL